MRRRARTASPIVLAVALTLAARDPASAADVEGVLGFSSAVGGEDHRHGTDYGFVVGGRVLWLRGDLGFEALADWRPLVIRETYYRGDPVGASDFHASRFRAMGGVRWIAKKAFYARLAVGAEIRAATYHDLDDDGDHGHPWDVSAGLAVEPAVGFRIGSGEWSGGIQLALPIAYHPEALIQLFGNEGETTIDFELAATLARSF
jgi:hypothetical protein